MKLRLPSKKEIIFAIFLCFCSFSTVHAQVINEVMAFNTSTVTDPAGNYSDWIEIYNSAPFPLDLANYTISNSTKTWTFSSGTLVFPNSYVLLWANNGNNPATRQLNFTLNNAGDTLTLKNSSSVIVSQVTIPSANANESYGRLPDGTGSFQRMGSPSPGSQNTGSSAPPNPNAGFIKINEIVLVNTTGLTDEDGQRSGWVELYNAGFFSVNLLGLGLSDSGALWTFPDFTLGPGAYKIIYLSGKNRKGNVLHTNFTLSASGETITYLNTDGSVVDTVDVPAISANLSYGRIPNGSGTFKTLAQPTPGAQNQDISVEPTPNADFITINEVMTNNITGLKDFQDQAQDWIELYNKGFLAVNLEGLKLTDSTNTWIFPSFTLNPGEYQIVFASGKNLTSSEFHTNFDLNSGGETLQFLNKDNSLIDSVSIPALSADVSYGRIANAFGNFQTLSEPTPGADNVANVNHPPVLSAIGNKNVNENASLNFSLSASDPDGDPVTITATGLKSWMTFDGSNFSATPDFLQAGNHDVTFTASDGTLTDTETITITVNNVNRSPVLNPIGNKNVAEGATLNFTTAAFDPDGDPVTITTTGLKAWMSFDGTNFSATPGFGDAGNHDVTFTASDGSLTDSETVTVAVGNTNRAPVLSPIGSKNIEEGGTLDFSATASDPDGDPVTITATGLKSWMTFNGSAFSANPGFSDAGNYDVTFTASDGSLTDSETVTISVGAVNRPPVLSSIGNKNVAEGSILNFTTTASDPDGDPVTITATGLKLWMNFNGSAFSANPNFADAGNYDVTFTASDASLTDAETITITVTNVNRPPVLDPIGNKNVAEGAVLNFTTTGSDPDSDPVTITATGLKSWMNFNGSTFSVNPGFSDAGNYDVAFTASDGSLSDSETITISVGAVNRPPVLNPIGNKTLEEGASLNFIVGTSDPDGDSVTVSVTGLKAWMSFDGTNFSATPGFGDIGNYALTFTASDGSLADSETVTIAVTKHNRAPVLDPIGNKNVAEGATLNFSPTASDPDGDPVTITAAGLKPWMSFDGTNFSATPGFNDAGNHDVTFTATDGSLSDSETISITVSDVNRAPVLNPVGNKNVAEGEALNFTVSASDPDKNSFDITAQGLTSWMSFDGTTFSAHPSLSDAGHYPVIFMVSDGNLSDSESITITVGNVNRPPVLNPIGDKTIDEGAALDFTVGASDPDSDPVTITATGLKAWMTFDGTNFSATPGFGDAGNHDVTFTVSDGTLSDSETITVSVGHVNRPPVLDPIGNKNIGEGATLNFSPTASDPDSDPLTVTATGLKSWMTFDGTNFSATPGFGDAGNHDVTFTVSDGTLSDSETITVSVGHVNRPPVLDPIGNKSGEEGGTFDFTTSASDPDGDPVTITATGLKSWMTFNGFLFSATPDFGDAGHYDVTFTASDGSLSDSEKITVSVGDVNQPPVINPIGNKSVDEGGSLDFAIDTSDPDGDPVTASVIGLLPWMDFDGTDFSAHPGFTDAGIYNLIFNASDGHLSDSKMVTLTVSDVNRAPVLNSVGNRKVLEEDSLNFTVTASDPDDDTLEITATGLTPWMTFNGFIFTANPSLKDAGSYPVTFAVTDGNLTDSETITITVDDMNQAPILSPIGNRNVDEGGSLDFTVSTFDPDGDPTMVSVTGLLSWMNFDGTYFSAHPGFDHEGTYSLVFEATDGDLTDSESITLTVHHVNRPPVIDPVGEKTVKESGQLNFTVTASDPDGDPVTVIADGLTSWMTFSDLNFSAAPEFGTTGDFPVTFSVSDGEFTETQTALITVTMIPRKPAEITSPADGSFLTESTFLITWDKGVGADEYYLDVGAKPASVENRGYGDFHSESHGTHLSALIDNITLNGSEIYAAVWSHIDGTWKRSAVVVYSTQEQGEPAQIVSPANGSTLAQKNIEFAWNEGTAVSEYFIDVGSNLSFLGTRGGGDILAKNTGTSQSATAEIPLKGTDIHAVVWSMINGSWKKGDVFTYKTEGGYLLQVDPFPYFQSLNNGIDPVEKFSGPAVAKMLLTYLWWNRLTDPAGPPALKDSFLNDQKQLLQYGRSRNYSANRSLDRLDAQGLWNVIQQFDPPYSPYHYNFGILTRPKQIDALNDIAKWLAYAAGGGHDNPSGSGVDGYPVHIPGAIPIGGNYDHWVTVRGMHTSGNPWKTTQYGIYGFWINDPNPNGLGENTFVTAEQFSSTYFLPITTGISSGDPNYNKWVTVLEPPEDNGSTATIVKNKRRLERPVKSYFELTTLSLDTGEDLLVYAKDHLDEEAFDLIQAAIDGIEENLIPYDKEFADIFKNTIPRKPIFVNFEKGDYYLVPFELPFLDKDKPSSKQDQGDRRKKVHEFQVVEGGHVKVFDQSKGELAIPKEQRTLKNLWKERTVAIAIIDAQTGAFKEVTWVKEPVKYLPVSQKGAFRLLAKALLKKKLETEGGDKKSIRQEKRQLRREIMDGAEIELIYIEGSLYYPYWKIFYDGTDYYIDQKGNVLNY